MQKLFTLRDTKAGHYGPIITKASHAEITRDLSILVNDKEQPSMVAKFAEDFDLFEIGEYDQKTGKIQLLDAPHHILKADSLKTV